MNVLKGLFGFVLATTTFGCAAQRVNERFEHGGTSYLPTLVEDLPPPDSAAYPKDLETMGIPQKDLDDAKKDTSVFCDTSRGIKDGANGDWTTLFRTLDLNADGAKMGDFPVTNWKLKGITARCDFFAINDVAIKPDLLLGAGNFKSGGTGAVMVAATIFGLNYSTGDVMMASFSGKITGLGTGQGKVEKSYITAGNIKRYLGDKRYVQAAVFAPNVFGGTLPNISEVFLVSNEGTMDGLWLAARQGTDYFNLAKLKKSE